MELAAHQSLAVLMSDYCKRQSSGELLTRKAFRSSAKDYKLTMVELHRPSKDTLKKTVPGQSLAAHRNLFENAGRRYQKHEPEIVCWINNCEAR
jgi:hypothetical protein